MSRALWIAALCLLLAAPLPAQDSDAPASAAARPQVAPELRERLLKLLPAPLPVRAVAQGAAEFYEVGIRHFDTAAGYQNGRNEERSSVQADQSW